MEEYFETEANKSVVDEPAPQVDDEEDDELEESDGSDAGEDAAADNG